MLHRAPPGALPIALGVGAIAIYDLAPCLRIGKTKLKALTVQHALLFILKIRALYVSSHTCSFLVPFLGRPLEIISPFAGSKSKHFSFLRKDRGAFQHTRFRFWNLFRSPFHYWDDYSIYHAAAFVKYGNAEKYEQTVKSCQMWDSPMTRRPYKDTIKSEEIARFGRLSSS